jgi:hypothetical protein
MSAVSCKKGSTFINTWTFKGTTYQTYACINNDSGVLLGSSISKSKTANSYDTIYVIFPSYQAPSGTYTIANYNSISLGPTQLGIAVTTGDTSMITYYSSGTGNTQVAVALSSAGMLTVSASGIRMQNASNPTDTSTLSLNLSQTQ